MSKIERALKDLREAMAEESGPGSYADSWHCNLAMSFYDACGDAVEHNHLIAIANEAASRFMKQLFDVDTRYQTD